MATWISHMMIVDNLLKRTLDLDKVCFCVGNVAPDCNVEYEDFIAETSDFVYEKIMEKME